MPAVRQAVREWRIKATTAAPVLKRPPEVQEKAMDLVTRKEVRTLKAAAERVEPDRGM